MLFKDSGMGLGAGVRVTTLHEGQDPVVPWRLSSTTAGKAGMDANMDGFVCQTKEFGLDVA